MITEINHKIMPDGKRYSQFVGLSTDTKPTTGVSNGSSFYEMDSGFTSYYDADSTDWTESEGD